MSLQERDRRLSTRLGTSPLSPGLGLPPRTYGPIRDRAEGRGLFTLATKQRQNNHLSFPGTSALGGILCPPMCCSIVCEQTLV